MTDFYAEGCKPQHKFIEFTSWTFATTSLCKTTKHTFMQFSCWHVLHQHLSTANSHLFQLCSILQTFIICMVINKEHHHEKHLSYIKMPPKKHTLSATPTDSTTNNASSKKPKRIVVHTKKYCSSVLSKKRNKNVINYWESSNNGDPETKLFCALFCKGNVHGNAFLNPLPQMILNFLEESTVVNMVVILKDFPDHIDEPLVSDNSQFSGPILGFVGTPHSDIKNARDFAAKLNFEAVKFINETHVNAYPVREFSLEELTYANGLPLSKIFHDNKDLWQALDMLFDCDTSHDNCWSLVFEDTGTHQMIYGDETNQEQAKRNLLQLRTNFATTQFLQE
jgi:hypothetical protein